MVGSLEAGSPNSQTPRHRAPDQPVVKTGPGGTPRHANENYLSLMAEATDTAVLICDTQWRILHVNAGFSRMLGWTEAEVAGHTPISLLASDMKADTVEAIRAKLASGHPVELEEIATGKHGERYWVKAVVNPILGDDGVPFCTMATLTDITSAKLHEALQRKALEAMVREQPLSEVLELICTEVERIAPEITTSILEVDDSGHLHPLVAPNLPASYSLKLDGMRTGPCAGSCGTAAWRNEPVVVDDIATDPLWAEFRHLILPLGYTGCWSTPIRNSQGRPIATFALYYRHPRNPAACEFHSRLLDACTHLCALALERERERRRIRELAFYDTLTGLPNRTLLLASTDQAIAAASRDGTTLAVLVIDLDRFKKFNDSLGHPAGDELLRRTADVLQRETQPGDIVGRLSSDEFVVVLPQGQADQVLETVGRLQTVLAEPAELGESTVSVSVSVGIALFPADGRDMETLLHRADVAVTQAKEAGRGQIRFFAADMNRVAQERLILENALVHAIQDHQLSLSYQPQIELATGHLHGIEALARWDHPQLGRISPDRFIPLAEDCNLIDELGHWALNEACRQLAAWRAQGFDVPTVSVNLSATSFHNRDLPRVIAAALADHGLTPCNLVVELTEGVLLDTHPNTVKTITDVHALGVRLSMDDFGTGYSSLSYLRRLPVSELKLDRSFVADLETDAAARALSRAILGLGDSLHLTVVAEGVETPEQNALLREQGYPVAQGYLFAQPMSPEALAGWLSKAH